MTRTIAALVLLAGSLASADANAFCVYNGLRDRSVQASVVATTQPRPAKLYSELVAPGKESCCNPKNTECNPGKVPDQALLAFEARVEAPEVAGRPAPPPPAGAAPAPQVVACGRPTKDPRFASGVEAPVPARAYLRFEANPMFNRAQKYGWENPPFILKVQLPPDNRVVATYACPPRQDNKPGRIDFLK